MFRDYLIIPLVKVYKYYHQKKFIMKIVQGKINTTIKKLYNFKFLDKRNLLVSFKANYETADDYEIDIRVSYHTINMMEQLIVEKMLLSPFVNELKFEDKNDRDQYGELLKQILYSFNDEIDLSQEELKNFDFLIQNAVYKK